MVRELAGYDPARAEIVAGWPLREGLLAFRNLQREVALKLHLHRVQVWAQIAPHVKAGSAGPVPEVPPILREVSCGPDS